MASELRSAGDGIAQAERSVPLSRVYSLQCEEDVVRVSDGQKDESQGGDQAVEVQGEQGKEEQSESSKFKLHSYIAKAATLGFTHSVRSARRG